MRRILKLLAVSVIVVLIASAWIGCSDSATTTSSRNSNDMVDAARYFPLSAGSSVLYMEVKPATNDTSYYRCVVGSPFPHGATLAYPWLRSNIEYENFTDTGYIFISENSVYYYENSGDTPEKLLEAPFEVGKAWRRFTVTQVNDYGDSVIDITVDEEYYYWKYGGGDGGLGDSDGGEDDGNNNGGTAKSYPTFGSNYFLLTDIEDIDLGNGNSFKDCIKVENSSSGRANQYWYAAEVGLVKYVLGIDEDIFPDGEIIGDIVSKAGN